MVDANKTVTFNPSSGQPLSGSGGSGGEFPQDLQDAPIWNDQMISNHGFPIIDVPFVTVGGGIGSFVMVDYLRVAGVPKDQIKVLTNTNTPHRTYETLCANSQIPRNERLRSDSAATPDNLWGFPGYAIREGWKAKEFKHWWQVFVEPVFQDFYTPRAGDVFESIDKEAKRIGWAEMLANGQVRQTRRRQGGGYYTVLNVSDGKNVRRFFYRSQWVHISVGYPALRYLPDLQTYRTTYPERAHHVVNAYQPHDHVYEDLKRRPGVVMVRGAGIVASRILQRLIEDRDNHGAQTLVYHLFRTYPTEGKYDPKWGKGKQEVRHGWAYQGFNVTKSSWGGQDRFKLLTLEGEERKEYITYLGGGAHTPRRADWREQIDRGLAQGFYRQSIGKVTNIVPSPDGEGVVTSLQDSNTGQTTEVPVRYIIDCTGLIGDPAEHRVLEDLLNYSGAGRNVNNRLDCERNFEVRGTQSPPGKLYAGGSATAGSYYGGVDSFLGLQYTAQQIYLDLQKQGFCKKIGPRRSLSHWLKWSRNKQI